MVIQTLSHCIESECHTVGQAYINVALQSASAKGVCVTRNLGKITPYLSLLGDPVKDASGATAAE